MVFATLGDLKAHLNYSAGSTANDVEMQRMLDAADELVSGIVGPLGLRAVTDTYPVFGGTVLLDHAPVGPVTVTGPTGTPVTGFTTRAPARLLTGVSSAGPVAVTFLAGSAAVPAVVRLATLIIGAHLWGTQRGAGTNRPNFPGEGEPDDVVLGVGYAIPSRARELLAPYLLPTGQVG